MEAVDPASLRQQVLNGESGSRERFALWATPLIHRVVLSVLSKGPPSPVEVRDQVQALLTWLLGPRGLVVIEKWSPALGTAYLSKSIEHQLLSHLRVRKNNDYALRGAMPAELAAPQQGMSLEDRLTFQEIVEQLQRLELKPEDNALLRGMMEDRPDRELAELLNVADNTAAKRKHRLLLKIRSALGLGPDATPGPRAPERSKDPAKATRTGSKDTPGPNPVRTP